MRASEKENAAMETGALLLTRAVLQREEKRGAAAVALLIAAALGAGALSLACAHTEEGREGELARAVSFVESIAAESEAIAVFLGLGEAPELAVDAEEDEICKRAEEYIREHNAKGGA